MAADVVSYKHRRGTMLAAIGLTGNVLLFLAVISVFLVFLAWVLGSDARTNRLTRLMRAHRGGGQR